MLRYAGQPKRVYFNRNRDVGVYFSAHPDDTAWYPVSLWQKIDLNAVQKKDQERLNIIPKSGMEVEAFLELLRCWEGEQVAPRG